ncbi:trans-aconitate 2-methyltransferase [Propionicimonas sp.]|uniref:class I SAM-dependent methyltransferase n=1 Tax=Propionicimonas sp. TaxID=1955623 RepID=UPI0017F4FB36|nr:class I SAM-dependent methyltransferase [Propionicimonas sp.]MBU3976399.1 class I SAM-dependent methyltransferase [Actinomycetota bacterium]MBA3022008.1 class I SAM-dependent methyltransferase [Propionicimonas sp.]MBU3987556.1 class I SAM-dependent methyltransferase [Actinomycetota bacterium]MBU4006499.1 class I SAM-dependent methyltransferase [Actinomycetota bacterium]MBU4065104.1 class I SAM-dependent methyltransferase [Actinomycetota bacterium]
MELLEWDAKTYDSLPLPHTRWGAGVIERLGLRGTERIVDLGCGTGRDTQLLLDLVPNGHVVAVDGSQQMLTQLRARLGEQTERVEIVRADLTSPFPPAVRGEAIMSVATFHWVPDHPRLFQRVANALPAGGRFEAEFGGAGNIAAFQAALKRAGGPSSSPWDFATAAETAQALTDAGFVDVEVRTVTDPAVLERGEQLEAFIATVLLGAVLRDLPPAQGRALVQATAAELEEPVIDYVRVQLSATRA